MSKSQEIEDSDRGLVILAGYLKFALEFYIILILSQNHIVTSLILALGSIFVTTYIFYKAFSNTKLLPIAVPIALFIPVLSAVFMPMYNGWIISVVISVLCSIIMYFELNQKPANSFFQVHRA
jgi:phosphate/sulfate permease